MSTVITQLIEVPKIDGKTFIGVVTLNRPKVKNALNKELCLLLAESIQKLRDRADVDAMVLIGSGDCFSAGVDLKDPLFAGEILNQIS